MPRASTPIAGGGKTATSEMVEADLKRKLTASALEVESLKRELATARSLGKGATSEAAIAAATLRERTSELEAQLQADRAAAEREREESRSAIDTIQRELRNGRDEMQTSQQERRPVGERDHPKPIQQNPCL